MLLHSRAHSLLVCSQGDLLLPTPILALCWLPSGVAPLAASLSQGVIFQFHICVGPHAFLFIFHHSHHSFHHVLRFFWSAAALAAVVVISSSTLLIFAC